MYIFPLFPFHADSETLRHALKNMNRCIDSLLRGTHFFLYLELNVGGGSFFPMVSSHLCISRFISMILSLLVVIAACSQLLICLIFPSTFSAPLTRWRRGGPPVAFITMNTLRFKILSLFLYQMISIIHNAIPNTIQSNQPPKTRLPGAGGADARIPRYVTSVSCRSAVSLFRPGTNPGPPRASYE